MMEIKDWNNGELESVPANKNHISFAKVVTYGLFKNEGFRKDSHFSNLIGRDSVFNIEPVYRDILHILEVQDDNVTSK